MRAVACSPLSDRPGRAPGGIAQGLVRRRIKRPSDDAAESGTALVSSMMEPIALTPSSPDTAAPGALQSGCGYLNRNAVGMARRNRALVSHPVTQHAPGSPVTCRRRAEVAISLARSECCGPDRR